MCERQIGRTSCVKGKWQNIMYERQVAEGKERNAKGRRPCTKGKWQKAKGRV